jgi:hypothetical protein
MKTSRKPEVIEIKATNTDRNDYTEGRITYFYSERRKLQPNSHNYAKKLLADGYHHLKGQDLRNGRMMFVRNARVVVEVLEYRSPRVKVYQVDITDQMKKLTGETASPSAVYKLSRLIAAKRVAVFLAEGEVSVRKA